MKTCPVSLFAAVPGLLLCTGAGTAKAQVPLAEAVDTPALTWITGGDKPWQGLAAADAKSGEDLVRCGPLSDEQFLFFGRPASGWMQTTVSGPGTFRVFIRTNSDPYLTASLSVDGVAVEELSLEFDPEASPAMTAWQPLSCVVPSGTHTVRLTACLGCDAAGTMPLNSPVVEADFAVLLPPSAAAGEAMDAVAQTWFNAGDPGGVVVQDVTHDGSDAVFFGAQTGPSWLQTEVTGPATLTWWRKGRAVVSVDRLAVTNVNYNVWTRETAFVPPGIQAVRWDNHSGSGLWLDGFSLVAESAVSLAEALDVPERTFTASPGWEGHTTGTAVEGGDLISARVTTGAKWLETSVTGPALVECAWRIRGTGADFTILMDGQPHARGNGFYGTENSGTAQVAVPAGVHTVRWEAVPFYFSPANMLVMLDAVKISPASPAQLDAALDGPGPAWTTGGNVPWQASAATYAHDGTDMVHSPALLDGQTAWLATTVTGPGSLSVRVRSLFNHFPNGGMLVVDNRVLHAFEFNSPVTWRREVVELPAGVHTIRFQMSGPSKGGALLLDEAVWTPAAAPPISAALDFTAVAVHSAGAIWSIDDTITSDGVDALRIEQDLTDYFNAMSRPVTLWVDGPAILTLKARCEEAILKVSSETGTASAFSTNWTTVEVTVPPGRRGVELVSHPSANYFASPRISRVDAVTLTPTAVPLAQVLSNSGLVWTTNPANPWNGIAAGAGLPLRAGSGPADAAEISWLETSVTGPAVVVFDMMGQAGILMDGVPYSAVAGNSNGTPARRSTWVPPGPHTLRWIASSGAIAAVSRVPIAGLPSLTLTGGTPVFTVPLPAGSGVSTQIETAVSPSGPWTTLALTAENIIRSTSTELMVRLPAPAGSTRIFARAKYL